MTLREHLISVKDYLIATIGTALLNLIVLLGIIIGIPFFIAAYVIEGVNIIKSKILSFRKQGTP